MTSLSTLTLVLTIKNAWMRARQWICTPFVRNKPRAALKLTNGKTFAREERFCLLVNRRPAFLGKFKRDLKNPLVALLLSLIRMARPKKAKMQSAHYHQL